MQQLTTEQSQGVRQNCFRSENTVDGNLESNMETIRSCLDVMVEQTHTSAHFWDSISFLHSYPPLTTEYLERLIKREVQTGQRTTCMISKATS